MLLFITWNVVTSRFQGLLEMKIGTDSNKENNEDENCGTNHHDMILGSFFRQSLLFLFRSGLFDNCCVTTASLAHLQSTSNNERGIRDVVILFKMFISMQTTF